MNKLITISNCSFKHQYCIGWFNEHPYAPRQLNLQVSWREEESASLLHGSSWQDLNSLQQSSCSHTADAPQSHQWFSAAKITVILIYSDYEICVYINTVFKFRDIRIQSYRVKVRVIITHLQEALWTGRRVLGTLWRNKVKPNQLIYSQLSVEREKWYELWVIIALPCPPCHVAAVRQCRSGGPI